MKTFIVIFTLFFVGAMAALTEEQKAKLKQHHEQCLKESGVDPAVVEEARKGNYKKDPKFNCFATCMLKKIGILNPDTTLNEAILREKIPKEVPKEKLEQVIKECKNIKGDNACETGAKMLGCYKTKVQYSIFADA